MSTSITHPKGACVSLSLLVLASVGALATPSCDAYTCTTVACDSGGSWSRCIACYEDSCTYETRDGQGEAVDTCDYDTNDGGARDACYGQATAAGEAICSGASIDGPGGGCASYHGCDACTTAGCAYCAPAGQCQDYGTGQTCEEPTVDLPGDCGGG